MKKFFKKVKDYISSTLLCIRFPFLFVKGDYVNNYIYRKQTEHRRKYDTLIRVKICTESYIENFKYDNQEYTEKQFISHKLINKSEICQDSICISDTNINIIHDKNDIIINKQRFYIKDLIVPNYNINNEKSKELNDIIIPEDITDVYIHKESKIIDFGNKSNVSEYITLYLVTDLINDIHNYDTKYITVVLDKKQKYYMKFYNMLNNILRVFYTFTDFSYYDDIPKGWRNKFGIQLCKDIKHSLIYTYINNENISKSDIFKYIVGYWKGIKLLYSFRITQVKEKFGTLRIYTAASTKEIDDIIDKYENISYNTCICCGKPAEYITTGWISPYCSDCLSDKEKSKAYKLNGTADDNNLDS